MDGTSEILREILPTGATLLQQPTNIGKTAAVRAGLNVATGDWIIVQDADLEYDPRQIANLMQFAGTDRLAVYGRRPSHWNRPSRWILSSGVLFIDFAIALLYGQLVRDHATCYKLIPTQVLRDIQLESSGFEGCVEITTKLIRSGIPIVQVSIQYEPRTAAEGKKLTVAYGWTALKTAWRYRHWTPNV